VIETVKIAIFKGRKIRKIIYNNEWWFVIVDVVTALTDSVQPVGYIKDMRRRDPELATHSLSFPRKWESSMLYA
jgi:prophage antirepressor-like protein